jgi:hypothetical protein
MLAKIIRRIAPPVPVVVSSAPAATASFRAF